MTKQKKHLKGQNSPTHIFRGEVNSAKLSETRSKYVLKKITAADNITETQGGENHKCSQTASDEAFGTQRLWCSVWTGTGAGPCGGRRN